MSKKKELEIAFEKADEAQRAAKKKYDEAWKVYDKALEALREHSAYLRARERVFEELKLHVCCVDEGEGK